jgi:tetratricopeptide (TPR) repeat protein
MIRRALEIREKQFGPRHPSVANNRANLGSALIDQGRYDEAERILRDGLEIVTSVSREGQDASIARLSFQLARVRLARHDAVEAERLLRDALRRQLLLLAPDDWLVAATKSALGAALTELGQLDEAERHLTEAIANLTDVPGREGREAAVTRERLAALRALRSR